MNEWYPVCLSGDLPPSSPLGIRIASREVVLWRDGHGEPHAWEDRCPHRGMRLSFGFIREGRLACLYHGWQFSSDTRCRHIPAHPALNVPSTIHTQAYRAAEQRGLVWVCFDTEATLAISAIPQSLFPVRSLMIHRNITDIRHAFGFDPTTGIQRFHSLSIAVLEVTQHETMLHIMTSGQPTTQQKKEISYWAQGMRDALERGADVPEYQQ